MFSLWSADTSKGTATDRNAPWEFLYFLDDVTSLAEWKKSEKKRIAFVPKSIGSIEISWENMQKNPRFLFLYLRPMQRRCGMRALEKSKNWPRNRAQLRKPVSSSRIEARLFALQGHNILASNGEKKSEKHSNLREWEPKNRLPERAQRGHKGAQPRDLC